MVIQMIAPDSVFKTSKYSYKHIPYLFAVCATMLYSGLTVASERQPQKPSAWITSVSRDGKGCFVTKEFDRPGRTTLLMGIDIDGANRLTVLNENWSIKLRDRLELDFRLSNVSFPKHFAIGITSGQKKGFVTSFGGRFPTHFASSKFLQVFRGNVPVEQLSLDGSGTAVVELRDCVEARRKRPVVTSGKRGQPSIPKDPFARTPESKGAR